MTTWNALFCEAKHGKLVTQNNDFIEMLFQQFFNVSSSFKLLYSKCWLKFKWCQPFLQKSICKFDNFQIRWQFCPPNEYYSIMYPKKYSYFNFICQTKHYDHVLPTIEFENKVKRDLEILFMQFFGNIEKLTIFAPINQNLCFPFSEIYPQKNEIKS